MVQEAGLDLSRIERLPEDLVNKIAAGEVVERPASVVKELVENAIDAEARAVHVEIEAGGKSLIRVRDDGGGMGRADAEMALERHATSKLRALADLQSILTHGFRGEALPSIASVSDLLLRTRDEAGPAGTEVAVRHGRLQHVRDAGHPRGTTVEVRDLFGAVPARRKFLRADTTETAHVAEALTLLALARPRTGFFLKSGGRPLIEAPPVEDLGARIYQVFGARRLEDLVAVEGGEGGVSVGGFVSRPDRPRSPRPALRLFVNRRPVRDRALAKAVAEGYRTAGGGGRAGDCFLFLDLPPHMVDVNVHPAKTEVRFADARTVWAVVERSVRQALAAGVRRAPPASSARAEAAVQSFLARADRGPGRAGELTAPRAFTTGAPVPAVAEAGSGEPAAVLTVLGQHRNTYIVATDGEELVLVDQHTAHERVRFERLLEQLERRAVESQMLLSPLVIDLSPDLRTVLAANADGLAGLGYDVEEFGAGSVRVRAVPAVLGTRDPGPSLESFLRDVLEREATDWIVAGTSDRLAATLACHSVVRAGQALNAEAMTAIVRDLGQSRHPTLCPHGRPTMVRIPRDDVSRWFGRSGWRRR